MPEQAWQGVIRAGEKGMKKAETDVAVVILGSPDSIGASANPDAVGTDLSAKGQVHPLEARRDSDRDPDAIGTRLE